MEPDGMAQRPEAARAIQEKQLLLSRMFARLAHEVRNPLSSLGIHVQLLEEDLAHTPPEVRARSTARFRIIRTELERLDNLVKQFLSLSGRTALARQPVDLAEVIGHVTGLLRPEAVAHAIAFDVRLAPGLPRILADPDQLTQALVNLLLNAIQAVGRDGRVEITAAATAAELAVTVADTGPGFDAANEGALFEPFFTTKEDGSGLGLWIVRQIAVAHGGSVGAGRRDGAGAVFTLTLPIDGREPAHG